MSDQIEDDEFEDEDLAECRQMAVEEIEDLCDAALQAAADHVMVPGAPPLPMRVIVKGVLEELTKFTPLQQRLSTKAILDDDPPSCLLGEYLSLLRDAA